MRNVCIVAHIDAGKTTTTERMLVYAGVIRHPGEVHHGNTVMDYLPQERTRGITISAAAISFEWRDARVTLVDTPGHVDFGVEVDRTLAAVDGAVVVVDGTAGVEAQTEAVWAQAERRRTPRVIFCNKMDAEGATPSLTLDHVTRLRPALTANWPLYGAEGALIGVHDFATADSIYFEGRYGETVVRRASSSYFATFAAEKMQMLETLADVDAVFMEYFVANCDKAAFPDAAKVREAMRRVCIGLRAVPVFYGAAFRNIGVQCVLDGVVDLLPAPQDALEAVENAAVSLLLAFKVSVCPRRGPLVYARVFRGTLHCGVLLTNLSRDTLPEKAMRLFFTQADDFSPISHASAGQIVVIQGLRRVRTGDILSDAACDSCDAERIAIQRWAADRRIVAPSPTLMQAVEAETAADEQRLLDALANFELEDPSFRVVVEQHSNQIVMYGVGELHLEVLLRRLTSEIGIKASAGKVGIIYKEAFFEGFEAPVCNFSAKSFDACVSFAATISTCDNVNNSVRFCIAKNSEDDEKCKFSREELEKCFATALRCVFQRGFLHGHPIAYADVCIERCLAAKDASNLEAISDRIYDVFSDFFRQNTASLVLMEPFVHVKIEAPARFIGPLTKDFVSQERRGEMLSMETLEQWKCPMVCITGRLPIASTIGYAQFLRSTTGGHVSIGMKPDRYFVVEPFHAKQASP